MSFIKYVIRFTLVLLAVAGCRPQTVPITIIKPNQHATYVAKLQHINTLAHQCWVKDPQFKPYGIIPELDTTAMPRILIVPKGNPQALPKLVIMVNNKSVKIFGPLTKSPLSTRIQSDLNAWNNGATSCNVNV